ncbi:MAG: NuoM family protein [Saprospiraceae bacterium]
MITLLLILIPIVGMLVTLLVPQGRVAQQLTLGIAGLQLGMTIYSFQLLKSDAALLTWRQPWIPDLGAEFYFSMDGISLLMVLLTNLLYPFIMLSTWNKNYQSSFYSLMLLMQGALIGVFTAMDGFLFYIFWELALIPIYFICLRWGAENSGKITFKFFVYTLTGSLLMLVALIYVYLQTPDNHTFAIDALYAAGKALSAPEQAWIFFGLFAAFAVKMPVFPFHTWQPDTYVAAPTAGTMLLSGIMLKMGTYGLIRWLIPIAPLGWQQYGNIAIILSVIGIVYASAIAMVQKDFKRLIAYSSIAHVGLIAAGLLAFNVQGVQGGIFQMLSHGINVVGLFYIVDIIQSRMGTRNIAELGGIRNVAPTFAVLFLMVLLGSVALPMTNGFVGEFLLLTGVYQYNVTLAVFAGLTVILGAVYMLRSYQGIMLGEVNMLTEGFKDLDWNEKVILISLVILIIVFGVYPQPLLDTTAPAVELLIKQIVK